MPKSAAYLTPQQIQEFRDADANLWANVSPTYMNLMHRLLCDVSEDNIPEPDKGKIILLIRQLGKKLQPYSG